jgi:uncharacterized protein
MDIEILALLFATGLLAGFVDSIAGGGGLISVPALMFAGLDPVQALATNKVQGSVGTLSSSIHFMRHGQVDPRNMLPAILCSFVGAALGALVLQTLDPSLLRYIVPVLLVGAALYFLLSPRLSDIDAQARFTPWVFALTAGFGIGFYDGFFGPGTGSFFAIACVTLLGHGLKRATAHTKVLNLAGNLGSLLFFILGGHIVWLAGGAMAAGQVLGARLGAGTVVKHGAKIVRPMLVVISLAMTASLLLRR